MIDKSKLTEIVDIKGIKGVYCLTSPCGKRYVGIGVGRKGIYDRLKKYLGLYDCIKPQRKLYNALKFYGPENFNYEVILETDDVENAKRSEMYLIDVWNLQDDNYGYNINDGGDAGKQWSDEERKVRSEKYTKLIESGEMIPNTSNMIEWTKNNKEIISERHKSYWLKEGYREDAAERASKHFTDLWKREEYKKRMNNIHKNASKEIRKRRRDGLIEFFNNNKDVGKKHIYTFLINDKEVSHYSLEQISKDNDISIHILRHLVSKKKYKPREINIKFISKTRKGQ